MITDDTNGGRRPLRGYRPFYKIFRSSESLAYTSFSEPTEAVTLRYLYEGLPLETVCTVPLA